MKTERLLGHVLGKGEVAWLAVGMFAQYSMNGMI